MGVAVSNCNSQMESPFNVTRAPIRIGRARAAPVLAGAEAVSIIASARDARTSQKVVMYATGCLKLE